MSDSKEKSQQTDPSTKLPVWWQCVVGAFISGGIAAAAYGLTTAIAQTFAEKPIESTNAAAISIGSAVRTLVIGMTGLATFVFAFATLGLLALGLQRIVQQLQGSSSS